jgi:hypothetical protein
VEHGENLLVSMTKTSPAVFVRGDLRRIVNGKRRRRNAWGYGQVWISPLYFPYGLSCGILSANTITLMFRSIAKMKKTGLFKILARIYLAVVVVLCLYALFRLGGKV